MTAERELRARVRHYPSSDAIFKERVETSLAAVSTSIDEAGLAAAVEAMLRTTYPLATVRPCCPGEDVPKLDAFRDGAAFDAELVRLARSGDLTAVNELYERHHQLAYRAAAGVVGDTATAAEAVVAAFRSIVFSSQGAWPVRVQLAIAARAAAYQAIPDAPLRSTSRLDLARTVVDLAIMRLTAKEIEAVLDLPARDVALLAVEGLRAARTT
jgi:hypothetical protein